MKRLLSAATLLLVSFCVQSQLLTWTPAFPKDNDNITITVDATKGNQGLLGFTGDVYVHIGVITNLSTNSGNWLYAPFAWGSTNAAAKATADGTNKWKFTINNIRSFFGVPAGETIKQIAILFRDGAGDKVQRNTDGSDMYIPVYDNSLATRFTVPPFQPKFIPVPEPINKEVNDNINVTAIASQTADMKLYLNGTVIETQNAVTSISANPILTTTGNNEIVVEATAGATTKKDTLRFFVGGVNVAPLPPGVKDGINYAANNTEVTLVLMAPGKSRVSVIGEFPGSNWTEQLQYQMNKTPDGNYWWVTITNLTPGTEYAFQYLVDGNLKVGDPYAEKVLDPFNDGTIPASHYPGLRAYPAGQSGIVSIVQTAPPAYNWTINSFNRPDKRSLVVYELLLRDFLSQPNWNVLKDTLAYLQRMGINAIELMPFNEFDGNNSWGYNPSYFLAPDKYYGPKNKLKEFIDTCHRRGIAVIMDIALNHATGSSPLAALYWNSATNQTAANNPWFNVTATHPFSVFHDFNHQSPATQYYFKRVVEHWLTEYKLDGFRFDLSKGFTQTNSGGNVGLWGQYDASRVALWKKYYDTLQVKSPGSYAILEHFADDVEERELSDYGMMFWGNANHEFTEAAMGWLPGSNFQRAIHSVRNFSKPHLMAYMESHDEERLMYKNLTFGNNSVSTYNTRDTAIALKRIEMSTGFFMMIPGPKMIWQFGELGYHYSITSCHPGNTIPQPYPSDDCRTNPKPIRWDFRQEIKRQRLYDIYVSLGKLRHHPWYKDVFIANNINLTHSLAGGFKYMRIRSAQDTSMIVIVGNFDVTAKSENVTFPNAGTWYDYLNGNTFTSTGAAQAITLQPGEFHIYLNRNLVNAVTTPVIDLENPANGLSVSVYPNPADPSSKADIFNPERGLVTVEILSVNGQSLATVFSGTMPEGRRMISLSDKTNKLPAGIYLLKVQSKNTVRTAKFVIQK